MMPLNEIHDLINYMVKKFSPMPTRYRLLKDYSTPLATVQAGVIGIDTIDGSGQVVFQAHPLSSTNFFIASKYDVEHKTDWFEKIEEPKYTEEELWRARKDAFEAARMNYDKEYFNGRSMFPTFSAYENYIKSLNK